MNALTLPVEVAASMDVLANHLNLPDHDLLLVGDGSGTRYELPVGWACIAHDLRKSRVTAHVGALSCGTSNFAELFPYVQALWYHQQDHMRLPVLPVDVAILSDSELTVKCGNRKNRRNANLCLWDAIDRFDKDGYRLHWRHVPRNSNPWNAWADMIAGPARQALASVLKELTPAATERAMSVMSKPLPCDRTCAPNDPFAFERS
jgi:ribonuclease HI